MTLHIGIDPGLRGAISVLDEAGDVVMVADLPVIRDLSLAWIDGSELQSMLLNAIGGRPSRATIERVSSMPGQGIASSFQFGVGFGSVLSVLQAMHIPLSFVTPAAWKRSSRKYRCAPVWASYSDALHRHHALVPGLRGAGLLDCSHTDRLR